MKNTFTHVLVVLAFCLATFAAQAQVSLTTLNNAYTQDFNTLVATGTAEFSSLPTGWSLLETSTNANTQYAAGTGSGTAGNTYSLGLDGDRALGGLQSGTLVPTLGASFTNNTGATITSLLIIYTGEQWRLGATPRAQADRLDFQYSTDASSLSTGAWADVNELDFNAPILSALAAGALDGNLAANRTALNFTITGLAISPGSTFWFRWQDFNVASSDDALGIDDFSITPAGVPANQPTLTLTPSSLNFGEINLGGSKILSYLVKGSNLDDSLTVITTTSNVFSLSVDQVNYSDTLNVPDSTVVYVRFAPVADGAVNDETLNTNGSVVKSLPLSGSGYDPISHITPIATARTRSVGTKVTIAGRVTVADEQGSPSYVQDGTGGIPVFDFTFSNNVNIGDTVIVTGPIGVFNDQVQISGAGITYSKPDSTQRIIAPKIISLENMAANEGFLVTVQNVELVNKAFVFYPQSTERISNGNVQGDLRIDGDTNLPGLTKPQGFVDITGVVGRFRTSAQLLPRFRADVPGVSDPQTPADSIPSSETFDLVNWNLEFFGAQREDYPQEYGPADEPLQLQNVQTVLSSLHGDVIAVQEVSNETFFNALVNQLPGYASICSPRYSYSFEGPGSDFPPQKVCFIYDTATVEVLSYRPLFEQRYDSARLIDPSLLPGYPTGDPSSFWSSGRLPFLMTANVTINGVKERIHFINLHAKSGATQGDLNRRAYDAAVLKDSLDTHFAHDQVVVLGDWNDDMDQSIVPNQPSSYAAWVADSVGFDPITLALSLADARSTVSFNDVIDHQMITNDLEEEYIAGSAHIVTPFGMIPNYGTTTSDHLPVISRFAFTPGIVSLSSVAATVTEGDSVQVQLNLSKPQLEDTELIFLISNGAGASYGADYYTTPTAVNDTIAVVIPGGSTSASISIATIDDNTDELDETVTFNLLSQAGLTLADSAFQLTILDNDLPTIEFVESEVSRNEGSGAYSVRLRVSTPITSAKSVTINVADGSGVYYGKYFDYTTSPAVSRRKIVLTIPVGAEEVSFSVTPTEDILPENPEVITFTIESVSTGLTIGTTRTQHFTILDVAPCLPVFVVAPNPTRGEVNIWTLPANESNIVNGTLLGLSGETLATGDGTVAQLSALFTATLEGRRRGIYTLRLAQCDQVIIIRILKI